MNYFLKTATLATVLLLCLLSGWALGEDSLFIDSNGNVGVGTKWPAAKLEVQQRLTNRSGKNLSVDQDIMGTVSGGDRHNFGIQVLINSSSSGTQVAGSRQQLFGTMNTLLMSGETYLSIGSYNYLIHSGDSLVGNARGAYNYVRNMGSGSIDNAFSAYNYIRNDSNGTIGNAYGNYSLIDQSGGGEITKSFNFLAKQIQRAGAIGESYLFYGDYEGSPGTNWGVFVKDEEKNFFSGRVGIGRAPNTTYKLDVNGAVRGTTWENSDRRMKQDILPVRNALERIGRLNGVSFKWIDCENSNEPQLGIIAQEVEREFPQAVLTDSEGVKAVSYGRLVAPLIEAVKELKAENDSLKNQIKSLHAKMLEIERSQKN